MGDLEKSIKGFGAEEVVLNHNNSFKHPLLMIVMIKDGLAYTGDEPDYVLEGKCFLGDWIQLRKGFRHNGISRGKIYMIRGVCGKNEKPFVQIKNNKGIEIRVGIYKLKYITIQQREYVKARAMNNEKSVKRKKGLYENY